MPHSKNCDGSSPISRWPGSRLSYPGSSMSIANIIWKAFAAPGCDSGEPDRDRWSGITAAAMAYCGSAQLVFDRDGAFGRKPIDQRQPVEALAESPGEIVLPALGAQSPLLADLRHGQAVDEDIVHQRRTVGAEFALGAV